MKRKEASRGNLRHSNKVRHEVTVDGFRWMRHVDYAFPFFEVSLE